MRERERMEWVSEEERNEERDARGAINRRRKKKTLRKAERKGEDGMCER